jgi:hypothetical protein
VRLTTLLRLLEGWKQALDCNEYIVAILMDLSKAFDCLPHDILICKLSAYGLSDNATKLMLYLLPHQNLEKEKKGYCGLHSCINQNV